MSKSCLTCAHKAVVLKRSMFVFQYYIVTGRYDEVKSAQEGVDIGVSCEDWLKEENESDE